MQKTLRLNPGIYKALQELNNIEYQLPEELLKIRNDLVLFGGYLFGYSAEKHHLEWFKELVTNQSNDFLNLIAGDNLRICSPRDSAKTTWGSIFLAWVIGFNPNIRIILVSYSEDISLAIAKTVQRILESELYQELFPHIQKSSEWASLNWTVKRDRIIKDPTMLAVGMAGSISSRRADLIFIDDPIKSSKSIQSKAVRDEMKHWYDEVLEPCLVEGGRVVCMATRYREDDIHGTRLNEDNGFKVINQSAILINENGEEYSYWEKQHPLQKLQAKRKRNPVAFSSQYQNNPLPKHKVIIKPSWIIYIPSVLSDYQTFNIGVDLAASERDKADYSTAVCIGRKDSEYHVVRAFRARLTIGEFCDRLMILSREFLQYTSVIKIYIESIGYQVAFSKHFKQILSGLIIPLPIRVIPIKLKGDKTQRLSGISPFIEFGKTKFFDSKDVHVLVDELLNFGSAAHDDLVDGTVYGLNGFRAHSIDSDDVE